MLDVSTDGTRERWQALEGEGTLRLDLERLDIAPGLYHLDVGLYGPEWTEVLDYLWEVRTIELVGDPTNGPVAPPGRWRGPSAERWGTGVGG